MAGNEPGGEGPYRKARTLAGVGLLLLVFVLYFAEILEPTFRLDSIQLGLLLGTALLFLGVEGGKWLLK